MYDHVDAWPFKEPVDSRDVPDYYEIIKDPVGKNSQVNKYLVDLCCILRILVCDNCFCILLRALFIDNNLKYGNYVSWSSSLALNGR